MLVLIVDNDQQELALTDDLLKSGVPGVCTMHAVDVLGMLNSIEDCYVSGDRLPDLILLELHLPGMDGHRALQELKLRNATKNIPVVFYSRTKNPRNYLLALQLDTPLFLKGETLFDKATAINKIIHWYQSNRQVAMHAGQY
ncbi:Response regulator receiver domain-containing protein [Cnuella takakiae]|uniref:Response regulator receiver domain-containing protein n=1 Tax=Cnuella takakiae TaxID=1302690 RepID=A0A1M4Z0B0_9BACT|nr:response regulator [Cnuella takakiae]OLY94372.1 hypothetical protein BUE76_22670 [Cnuella takakiae]SHF11388.1 Response regulator receiver domain-containing protein [Cnuella takakiae]